jgi:protease I
MNRRNLTKTLLFTSLGLGAHLNSYGEINKPSKQRKILIPIGDATEAVDTLYPFFRLQEEGFKVTVCGPEARIYNMVTHEIPPNAAVKWDITREAPGYHITAEKAFKDIRPEDYDGIFVSGGRAPEYLRYDQDLLRITRHFFETNKPVSVVCHGVEIVAAAGVIKNRKLTTVAKCALDITQVGGIYVPEPLVVDGNLISCRTWNDFNTPFMKIFIEQVNKYKS